MSSLLKYLSDLISRIERWMLIVLTLSVTLLILLNVVTRSLNFAIYWVDELAIYAMIWMVMIGTSTTIKTKQGIAVTLLENIVGAWVWKLMLLTVDVIILLFATMLIWLSWIWYDPVTFMSFGFDKDAFSSATFNYIYDEPTLTIGVPKYLVWFIMPITAITMFVHAMSNLANQLVATGE